MKQLKQPKEAVHFVFALSCLKSKQGVRPGLPAAVTDLKIKDVVGWSKVGQARKQRWEGHELQLPWS